MARRLVAHLSGPEKRDGREKEGIWIIGHGCSQDILLCLCLLSPRSLLTPSSVALGQRPTVLREPWCSPPLPLQAPQPAAHMLSFSIRNIMWAAQQSDRHRCRFIAGCRVWLTAAFTDASCIIVGAGASELTASMPPLFRASDLLHRPATD